MKKLILSTSVVACLAGVGCLLGIAWGQTKPAAAPAVAHKVGLIDMAYIFNKYDKFQALRDDFRAEVEEREQVIKGKIEKGQQLAKELQSGDIKKDTPEWTSREKQMTTLQVQIQADRADAQREFLRKESKMYQTVYGEVVSMVAKYADYHKYTLIMRFNREELESDDPQKVMQALQRQVVYFQDGDDITDQVLTVLNKSYNTSSGSTAPRAPRTTTPAGGAKPAGAGASRN